MYLVIISLLLILVGLYFIIGSQQKQTNKSKMAENEKKEE